MHGMNIIKIISYIKAKYYRFRKRIYNFITKKLKAKQMETEQMETEQINEFYYISPTHQVFFEPSEFSIQEYNLALMAEPALIAFRKPPKYPATFEGTMWVATDTKEVIESYKETSLNKLKELFEVILKQINPSPRIQNVCFKEAISFKANNKVATLALDGLAGIQKTTVKVLSDYYIKQNSIIIHNIASIAPTSYLIKLVNKCTSTEYIYNFTQAVILQIKGYQDCLNKNIGMQPLAITYYLSLVK